MATIRADAMNRLPLLSRLICPLACVGGAHQRSERTTLDASVWATDASLETGVSLLQST